jgi:hypothetical protein
MVPFATISGDPEQEYFAGGMVEEIIFSNRPFRLYAGLAGLPQIQWPTRLILEHSHPSFSGVFRARLHRNYTRAHGSSHAA